MLGGVRLLFQQEVFVWPAPLAIPLAFPSAAAFFGAVPLKFDASYVPTIEMDAQYAPTVELDGRAQ